MKTGTIVTLIVTVSVVALVGTIAMCTGAFYFTFRSMDRSISPAIDSLFASISNDTFGDTYDTQTSPELRKNVTRKQYEDLGRKIRTRLGALKSKRMKTFNIRQVNITSYASVTYDGEFEKGNGVITAQFQGNGGRWLVVYLNVNSPEFQ